MPRYGSLPHNGSLCGDGLSNDGLGFGGLPRGLCVELLSVVQCAGERCDDVIVLPAVHHRSQRIRIEDAFERLRCAFLFPHQRQRRFLNRPGIIQEEYLAWFRLDWAASAG